MTWLSSTPVAMCRRPSWPASESGRLSSGRVPLMIVSAYSPQGKVTHQQYQHGSLLKFVEETFGVDSLTDLDARAYSPAREFNFSQQPRTFVPIRP